MAVRPKSQDPVILRDILVVRMPKFHFWIHSQDNAKGKRFLRLLP